MRLLAQAGCTSAVVLVASLARAFPWFPSALQLATGQCSSCPPPANACCTSPPLYGCGTGPGSCSCIDQSECPSSCTAGPCGNWCAEGTSSGTPSGNSKAWVCCQGYGNASWGAACTTSPNDCCLGPCTILPGGTDKCCGLHGEGLCTCVEDSLSCADSSECCSGVCKGNICLAPDGIGGCNGNADCASGTCTNGVCRFSPGHSCTSASQCASDICGHGFCDAGPDTLGQSCGYPPDPGVCTGTLACVSNGTNDVCCIPSNESKNPTCSSNSDCCGNGNLHCTSSMCCNAAGGLCETQDDCCSGRVCDPFSGCQDVAGFGCSADDQCLSGCCGVGCGNSSGNCTCLNTGATCGAYGFLSCCSGYCNSSNVCADDPGYDAGCDPLTCPIGQLCAACQSHGGAAEECAGVQTSSSGRCCIPGSSWEQCKPAPNGGNNGCCLTVNGTQLGCFNQNGFNICCNGTGGQCATSADCCPGKNCNMGTGLCG